MSDKPSKKEIAITINKSQVPGYVWSNYCKELNLPLDIDKITIKTSDYTLDTEYAPKVLSEKSKENFKNNMKEAYQMTLDEADDIPWLTPDDDRANYKEDEEKEELPKPEPFELSDKEKEHISVLERLAKKCYSSNKHGFTEKEKLVAISNELIDTDYVRISKDHFLMFYKPSLKELDRDSEIILITSHADNVKEITKPFSELSEDNQYLKGTYDNLGTNAASTILMKEGNMPDNVIFVFTANEESGKCTGLKIALESLKLSGFTNIKGISLDVTYEGYDEGMLCSLENMSGPMVERGFNTLLQIEPEDTQTFSVTPMDKKNVPEKMTKDYSSGSTGMFDEGFIFAKKDIPGISLCLPTDGEMHGNHGLTTRQPQFEGYILSLESLIYKMTKTNDKLIEEYKETRKELSEKTNLLVEYEDSITPKYGYNYYGYGSGYDFYSDYYNSDYGEDVDLIEEELSYMASYYVTDHKAFYKYAEEVYGIDIGDPEAKAFLDSFFEPYEEDYDDYDDYN